jgi:RND family efflux transporter MFP subunit
MNSRQTLATAFSLAALLTAGHALSADGLARGAVSAVADLHDVALTLPAEATVEAVRQSTVAAQVAGRVVDLRVDAGQRVKQGDILMRIDAREAAGADVAAQAALAQARAAYERSKNLHAQKFISQAALDQAETAWKAAQGAAGISGAALSYAAVTAPISGVVAQRHVELGELAAPGRPLVTVFDPRSLRVLATVPQSRIAEVRKSGRAWIEFSGAAAAANPDAPIRIEASKFEILPVVDARSHSATVRLYLPENIENVLPGMFARAHFSVGQVRRLTVPAAAVLRRGEVTAVYVLDSKGDARLRQVRLGEVAASGDVEILSGLTPGERVSLTPVKTGIEQKSPR